MLNAISNNVVCATSYASDQPAHTRSLIRAFASRLNILASVKLLTEHNLKILSLKEGSTGSSESKLVNMPHCWKPHLMACFRMLQLKKRTQFCLLGKTMILSFVEQLMK